jgi:ABC-type polysaccharide/polyol phosphate export permease
MQTLLTSIVQASQSWRHLWLLAFMEFRLRYRRSILGPLWLPISKLLISAVLIVIFSQVLKVDMREYGPYLVVSIIVWEFMQGSILASCNSLLNARDVILHTSMSPMSLILKQLCLDVLVFLANFMAVPIVFLALGFGVGLQALLILLAFVILVANVSWMCVLLAIMNTRFRDVAEIAANGMTFMFYLTPVIWKKDLISERHFIFVEINPFYHDLAIFRAPLLGEVGAQYCLSILVSVSIAFMGWVLALLVYQSMRKRLSYWV